MAETNCTILTAREMRLHVKELGALLHSCVCSGASINFILPFSKEASEAFWTQKVLPGLIQEKLLLMAAWREGRLAGSVQLDYDMPPNQRHRAEIRKLMVHPDFRRLGIAKNLMRQIEIEARKLGRRLLTLDTRTGDSAEFLYESLDYRIAGHIPSYCRDPIREKFDSTTLMYKILE